jgi:hypothetical protein
MLRWSIVILFLIPSVLQAQQTDSLKHRITRQWTLSGDFTEEVPIPVDTTFSLFHRLRITDKFSPFNAYPGNYGLPLYQIDFFDRVTDPDMFLYRYYLPFMHLPYNAVFMNTQVPFTEMVFSYAGPRDRAEQVFRVRHSQNVNRNLNFGLIYDIVYSLGQYSYQRSDDKTFTLFTSYTGEKYRLYVSGGINNIVSLENGGIVDQSQMSSFDTRDIEVKLGGLNKASNTLKERNLVLVQRYSLSGKAPVTADTLKGDKKHSSGLSGVFSHVLVWEKTRRSYSDKYPAGGFYDTTFISNTATFDSLSARSLKNTLRFDFSTDPSRKFSLGGGVGIRNELFRYSQIIPSGDTLDADTTAWHESNNVLVGRLYNNIGKKFGWVATGELFLTGYRAGDFDLRGNITKEFDWKKGKSQWNIFGNIISCTPSIWFERWGSNNFKWNDNFQKIFRIDAGTEFRYPARRTRLKFNYAIIDNYTYFGPDAVPLQHGGGLSVVSVLLEKEISAWKFHLRNDILLQQSSNRDVVDLPLLSIRSAGFFEHNFHFKLTDGNLNTQIGAEIYYSTQWHGYGYMPATGTYYAQQDILTGNYPYLNAFINIKLKRTRIFLMLDHFNSGLNGYNYFLVPSYPMNIRAFRYGLAWTFYD